MSEPRFRLVRGCTQNGTSQPEWPTAADPSAVLTGPDGCWSSWRLLGTNNRELGRGALVYDTDADCLAALARGQSQAITSVPAVAPQAGQWVWRLDQGRDAFAVSARSYQRQRECRYSLSQFLLALISARVPDEHDPALKDRVLSNCLAPGSRSCRRPGRSTDPASFTGLEADARSLRPRALRPAPAT